LFISKKLLEIFPNEKEGILDKKLASLVNKNKCYEIGKYLKLDNIVKIGNLKFKKQLIEKKIVSDSCEAIIGAIYLDKGFEYVQKFILKNWDKHIYDKNIIIVDAKTKLQEYSLKKFKILPIYKFISDTGPKHKPNFKVAVKLKNTVFVEAEGSSKKLAQQAAATKLLNILGK
jgi:ribonuclease-3